jgi:hypothetical protein
MGQVTLSDVQELQDFIINRQFDIEFLQDGEPINNGKMLTTCAYKYANPSIVINPETDKFHISRYFNISFVEVITQEVLATILRKEYNSVKRTEYSTTGDVMGSVIYNSIFPESIDYDTVTAAEFTPLSFTVIFHYDTSSSTGKIYTPMLG